MTVCPACEGRGLIFVGWGLKTCTRCDGAGTAEAEPTLTPTPMRRWSDIEAVGRTLSLVQELRAPQSALEPTPATLKWAEELRRTEAVLRRIKAALEGE